ncbi:SDR family NAD(P)-dependent oxidoreductase [Glaciecola sp. KUL10]|uniref:SDR family NAD(P)-dependent oxidoreductase n=1 Tax=Glaciecola sp. (strain KUL10) TaxID=2161813 RepID=UPI000D781EA5|nr:SDR family NAD(P)-dependent oxidoreductase [Glaciecola sp. KUL10]GBL06019.1 oxidoreductase, short-chain dehydrogenase/reductase family protein [Glaciecola sp. KUL10]
MNKNALVIGASGGIAKVLIEKLVNTGEYETVYTVSRSAPDSILQGQQHESFDTVSEADVDDYVSKLKRSGVTLDYVVCATGILHTSGEMTLKPEKRLEDMNEEQFAEYFRVNTVLPAIWLKKLVKVVNKSGATIIFFSARVGSITDNSLGGWYGYRASKAALNMLVKTAAIEYRRRLPNTVLVCYHPGTVNTSLSKPFQTNVKQGKLFSPDFTCESLLKISSGLPVEQSPYYLDWAGEKIPW